MSLRAAILLVILAAIASTERKQLSGPELERFLGPAGSNLIKWNKRIVPDGEFYEGSADPTTLGNSKHQYLTFDMERPGPSNRWSRSPLGFSPEHGARLVSGTFYLAGFDFGDARRRKIPREHQRFIGGGCRYDRSRGITTADVQRDAGDAFSRYHGQKTNRACH